jgi:excisionase family DNA binding protein
MAERYLLVEEVASIARTTPSTVRFWLSTGKLRSTRPGRRRLIAEDDLRLFLTGVVDERLERRTQGKRAQRP